MPLAEQMKTIRETDLVLPGLMSKYVGKVRDVYTLENDLLVMVASDRISAFDVILPRQIPGKGQVLNGIANVMLDYTSHIVPNWKIASPHPNVTIGHKCEPIRLEMVIRGYLTGHAWRTYRSGQRFLCGIEMPTGMKENDPFPEPIITPATKAEEGHDEDISREDILSKGIVGEDVLAQLEQYTRELFAAGTEFAKKQGLILVDTKYEFGFYNGQVMLMDEIHTPDSSRYFYLKGYEERQAKSIPQKQLSKEFVRQWLIEQGFQGREGEVVPDMPDAFVDTVSQRYRELYELLLGKEFLPEPVEGINHVVIRALKSI